MTGEYERTVEIDEAKFGRRKHHKAASLKVSGFSVALILIKRSIFFVQVPDRTTKILIAMIEK